MKFKFAPVLLMTFSLAATLVACESKFVESAPGQESSLGPSLDERMSRKNELDERTKQIQRSAEKIKNILNMFRKVQSAQAGVDVYTPIDLLIDINKELENKIPESSKEDTDVRHSKIEIPIDLLSKACRRVDVKTITEYKYVEVANKNLTGNPALDVPQREITQYRTTYQMKTCGSDGQFVNIMQSEYDGMKTEFRFFNKNLEGVWDQVIFTDKLEDSACKVEHDTDKILQSIYCKDFYLQLSVSERAHVHKLTFSNTEETRFYTAADIFENGKMKATAKMVVSKDGEVNLDLKKVP